MSGTSSGRESRDVPAVGHMLHIGRDLRNMLGRHRILQVAPRSGTDASPIVTALKGRRS